MTCSRCKRLEEALRVVYTAVRGDEKAQHHDARAWLDERGIFNGDLDGAFAHGDAVLAEVCRAALAAPVDALPCKGRHTFDPGWMGGTACTGCGTAAPPVGEGEGS